MDKIPTVEEFIHNTFYLSKGNPEAIEKGDVIVEKEKLGEEIIKFTKLHVQAELKKQAEEIIKAWEAIPGDRNIPSKQVEQWLINDMAPLIRQLRKGVVLDFSLENIK